MTFDPKMSVCQVTRQKDRKCTHKTDGDSCSYRYFKVFSALSTSHPSKWPLVDLDDTVDLGHKPETSEESNGSCEKEEKE